jgi:hypothetical protein
MGLDHRTIGKLVRESFSGGEPLVIHPDARDRWAEEIKQRLERFDDVDTKGGHVADGEKDRFVASFSIIDPKPHYYWNARDHFHLVLDDRGRLTIRSDDHRHRASALVSDLDEITRFVQHFRERLARQQALSKKREKVRQLKVHAILAEVKKLAKEDKFDFKTETDAQKLRLFVKLSDEHAVELGIPFKQFEATLPQLRRAIGALRHLYNSGIRFKIVGRAKVPWRKEWTKHETL